MISPQNIAQGDNSMPELDAEQKKAHKANLDKGVSALHKALAAKKVNVDSKALADAVKEAHAAAVENCDSCANGWHW
jgi:hypothetical protein